MTAQEVGSYVAAGLLFVAIVMGWWLSIPFALVLWLMFAFGHPHARGRAK